MKNTNTNYRNAAILASLVLALVLTVGWTDFRRSIANLVAGNLTVTEAATFSDDMTVSGDAAVTGTLDVTGAGTFDSTLDVTGNTEVTGTLDVTGAVTFDTTLGVTGVTTLDGVTFTDSSDTINGLWTGAVTIANGQTSNTVTLTGVASGDSVFVTPMTGNTNGITVKTAAVTANTVTLIVSGDPGADTQFSVLVIGN